MKIKIIGIVLKNYLNYICFLSRDVQVKRENIYFKNIHVKNGGSKDYWHVSMLGTCPVCERENELIHPARLSSTPSGSAVLAGLTPRHSVCSRRGLFSVAGASVWQCQYQQKGRNCYNLLGNMESSKWQSVEEDDGSSKCYCLISSAIPYAVKECPQ